MSTETAMPKAVRSATFTPLPLRATAQTRDILLDDALPAPLLAGNDITAGRVIYAQLNRLLKGEHRLTYEYTSLGRRSLPPSHCIGFFPWKFVFWCSREQS